MASNMSKFLYVFAMVFTVVLIDVLFFKSHTLARLIANIGIIALYAAFYLRFFKRG